MFSILRRAYVLNNLIVSRSLRGGKLGPNPGLDNRIDAFQRENIPVDAEDAEEFVESSASDLFSAGKFYKQHKQQEDQSKEILRHQIVKDKYFKENLPNLLTWSEKEQIRHLCNAHPEEWPPERIEQSFPVTAAVVKKLLKYPWKPASILRIARHDASALRNWKLLSEGALDIPDDLREHVLKFSKRNIPTLENKSIQKTDLTQDPELGEFQKIVDKCTNVPKDANRLGLDRVSDQDNNKVKKKCKEDREKITLEELKAKIKSRIDDGKEVTIPDEIILTSATSLEAHSNTIHSDSEITTQYEKKTNVVNFIEKPQSVYVYKYPERIRIPKKAYKKGATYKVNDCYYDHDGKFLYRVLGMSK